MCQTQVKTSLEKMVNGDKAMGTEESKETNEPITRNLRYNALAGDGPDSKEEPKEAVTSHLAWLQSISERGCSMM